MYLAISTTLAGCQAKILAPLSNDVKMSDPTSVKQLIAGFYGLEEHKWRWTARRFAVVFQPPAGSQQKGATLRLQLYFPDSEIKQLGPITLTTDVSDITLSPQTFSKPGAFSYVRTVPAAVLHTDLLPVVFSFDKALGVGVKDERELGAVVTEISLDRSE